MLIEDRVRKLESESRRWRACAIGLAVSFGLIISCQQRINGPEAFADKPAAASTLGNFDTIKVRNLQIVNEKGEKRGYFVAHEDWITLSFGDFGDGNSISLELNGGRPSLNINEGSYVAHVSGRKFQFGKRDADAVAKRQVLWDKVTKGGQVIPQEQRIKMDEACVPMPLVLIGSGEELGNGGLVNVFSPLGNLAASVQSTKNLSEY